MNAISLQDRSMDPQANRILKDALLLPEEQREEVVHGLLRSFKSVEEIEIEEEMLEEIRRRVDSFERGESEGIPWEEVRASVESHLQRRRAR